MSSLFSSQLTNSAIAVPAGRRLAIITTHPIQYYSPWFAYLTRQTGLQVRVFYLWDFGVREQLDSGFGKSFKWDVPLLEGYDHEFVENVAKRPNTNHFFGMNNPKLRERVEEFNPDAILMMAYNYYGLLRFLFNWPKDGAPIIFRGDSHRLGPRSGPREWVRQRIIRAIFRRFAACLYVGQSNRDYFLQHGLHPEQLFFSPHAVDNDRFMTAREKAEAEAPGWRQELGIPEHHAVVLFVGKLKAYKRPADLLAAFLKADPKDASLLFVGTGELEDELRNRAQGHENIHFAPFQNQSMMPRTFAAGDILALPSGPAETWGLVVNEAMCLGRSAIVSDKVGCAADLISHHENGLVFPMGNIDALSEAIKEALSNRDRLREWGRRSAERMASYSYKEATHGLIKALRELGVVS